MHTFQGPNGTRFHFNSDGSGDVHVRQPVVLSTMAHGEARVSVDDLLAFADHVRGNQVSVREQLAEARANGLTPEQMMTGRHREPIPWILRDPGDDSERREFIKQAAIAFMASDAELTTKDVIDLALNLWQKLQEAGL